MLLNRYFASHAFETLKEAKLKTSRITSFNDPFEFLFLTKGKITPEIARDYVISRLHNADFLELAAKSIPGLLLAPDPQEVLKAHISRIAANLVKYSEELIQMPLKHREQMADKSTRVICFSDSAIDPLHQILLWSHYAKSHEGVRIGFEFPNAIKFPFKIFKIAYQDRRFEVDFSRGICASTVGQEIVDSTKVKSLAWAYENEYRLLTHPDCCESRTMPNGKIECFLEFDRGWVKSIDFGVRCSEASTASIIDLTMKQYPNKLLYRKATFHRSDYALEYETMMI